MDWSERLICQTNTTESLKCPLRGQGSGDKSEAYKSFLNNVSSFRDVGAMPVVLRFGEEITADDLVVNQGVWHKSCYLKFGREKIDRAIKKRDRDVLEDSCSTTEEKRPRLQIRNVNTCLFWQKDDGHLQECSTLKHNENLREMALFLNDIELIARLSGGDIVAIDGKYHLQCVTALRIQKEKKPKIYEGENFVTFFTSTGAK